MSKVIFGDVVRRANTKEDRHNTDKIYYVGGEHIESNEVLVENRGLIEGSTIGPMFYFGFKSGDVLFVSRNPHLRKAGMVTFDGICSEKTFVLETKDESVLLQSYLPFVMQSDKFWRYMETHKSGSVNFFINWSTLEKYEFELPDIEKQKTLSDILWAINKAKRQYRHLIDKTIALVECQFEEMIRNSNRENTLGCYIKRFSPKRCGNNELPVLSVTKEKSIVFQDERFESSVASKDKSNYIVVPRGYIVQGIHIDEGNFGFQNITDEGIVSPAYKIWEIISNEIIPELLEYYLRSQKAIKYYTMNFSGTTVKRRQTIRNEDLLAMPLNLPDIGEQHIFWNFKVNSDKSISELQEAIENLICLEKSIIAENNI